MNKNEVKFRCKIPVNIEYKKNKQKLEILITERTDITPLLKFKLLIAIIQLVESTQLENEKAFRKFPDLFENNERLRNKYTI